MQWSLSKEFKNSNHHPVISVNGVYGVETLKIEAEAGTVIVLDASDTYDPDEDDTLAFKWWHYKDPTATQTCVDVEVEELKIRHIDSDGHKVEVELPPPDRCAIDMHSRQPVLKGQLLHLILEVTDSGTPPLTSYRRILIQCTNKDLKGSEKKVHSYGGTAPSDA
jgi:hypothetical protein